jgi:MFS family permease
VIRENFPKEQRATIVGTFFAGNKIGLMLGIPLSSVVYVYAGWIGTFLITGGIGLIWVIWWFAVYRTKPTKAPSATESPQPNIGWSTLLRYRTTWGIMLGQAGYLYIYYVFATWLPGYLVLQRHMSIEKTGMVGTIPFLVGAICVVLGGWGSDRLIRAGLPITNVRKGFAVGGLLAATIFTVLGAYTQDTTIAIALLTAAVGAFSLSTASANAMSIDVAPPHIVSSLVSLQNFGGNVGGSFAPIITGLLISASGNFAVPLLVTAGVALVFGCGSFGLIVGRLDRELSLSMLTRSTPSGSGRAE